MRQSICSHFETLDSSVNPDSLRQWLGTEEDFNAGTLGWDQNPAKQRGRTVSSPKIDEIKVEAETLRYFGYWRDSVLLRVGEALDIADPTKKSVKISRPSRLDPSAASQESLHIVQVSSGLLLQQPTIQTRLIQLPMPTKSLIIHSLLLLLLSLQHYCAHSRIMLLKISSSLGVSAKGLAEYEVKVAKELLDTVKEISGDEEAREKAALTKISRKWKVGIASVAGAALIGVTGGLAAPFVAGSIGAVMGGLGLGTTAAAGYLGVVAGNSLIVGALFGAYGGKMTGKMVHRYAREVEDFAFIPIRGPHVPFPQVKDSASSERRLRVTICISGWLTGQQDVIGPWGVLGDDSEVFALRWELDALVRLGNSLTALVRNTAWTVAVRQMLVGTVFAPIVGAIMWPVALLKIAHIVDNPFSVAKSRADKAGEILADALVNKAQGERPVTLIGYSLGARVIFSCLLSLANRHAFGLIESAILIGAPTPSTTSYWRLMRSVVSGRLVNVFSVKDSVLCFLYRISSIHVNVAGLQPILGISGIENFDVSGSVDGHLRYQHNIGYILNMIGLDHLNIDELQGQTEALKAYDRGEGEVLQLEQQGDQAKVEPLEEIESGHDFKLND
jgi:hypothetical protein